MRVWLPLLAAMAAITSPTLASPPDTGVPTPLPAQLEVVPSSPVDPTALALAREFLALSSAPELIEKQLIEQFKGMVLAMPGVQAPEGSEAARELDEILASAKPAIRRHGPDVAEAYAQAYARIFSVEELRQFVVFAASPAGKRLFAHATEVQLDTGVVAASQGMMTEALMAFDKERRAAACKQATARRVAAGDTKAKCPLA